ncbi:facilitated trehalose transporter Tret1-like [Hyposmocoma kahamanoa]|uniref:facilitated trehalose transporter Tret1-like n=1 Tax=Hyposmocoma kahamanoa TaxID=1477025 RepID=UPI000E6D9511|nr:facilitated trehalose transporter Tret1-like [Hyposmocoma kahamanoa]
MSILNQVIGTIVISTLSFNLGLVFTWPSGTINMFMSNDTKLDRPITESEMNLLGSLSSLAPLISTPVLAYLMDAVGRKHTAVASFIVPVITWVLIATMNKVEVILTAMFIGGLGGGALVVVPVYIGEICQESIRGTMAACTIILYSIGMMVSYIMAGLEYEIVIYSNLSMAVLGVISAVVVLKESPIYLMKKDRQQEAVKTIAYYRKTSLNSKEVLLELESLKRILSPETELQTLSPEQEKLNQEHEIKPKKKESVWQHFKKSPSTRRGLFVSTVIILSIFQGLPALQVYAEPVFTKATPNISTKLGTVLMALVTVIFGVLAGFLSDILGRKPLMTYASMVLGVTCILLGIQLQIQWAPQWVTMCLLFLYAISFTFGAGTVPYVLISEIFLPEVSSIMSMIIIEIGWVVTFLVVFIYQPCEIYLGTGLVFYLFAAFGFALGVFSIFFLPETKGLTVDAIQLLLVRGGKKNVRNNSF